MSWCLCRRGEHRRRGGTLRKRTDEWADGETKTVYPDLQPGGNPTPAPLPPEKSGSGPEMVLPPLPSSTTPTTPSSQNSPVEENVPSLPKSAGPPAGSNSNAGPYKLSFPGDDARQTYPAQSNVQPAAYQTDANRMAMPAGGPAGNPPGGVVSASGAFPQPMPNNVVPAYGMQPQGNPGAAPGGYGPLPPQSYQPPQGYQPATGYQPPPGGWPPTSSPGN